LLVEIKVPICMEHLNSSHGLAIKKLET